MLTVRLPDTLEKRLVSLAKKTHRPKGYYVREALAEYMEDLEDIYLADAALEDLRAGRGRTHGLDEVKRELGLER